MVIDGNIYLTEETNRVVSPATGNLVGLAPQVSEEQIDYAVVAAENASPNWAGMPRAERCTMLKKCAAVLREHAEALATLQTNESGRPIHETRIELMVAAACFDTAGVRLNIDEEEEISEDDEKRVVIRRSPIGVVAIIAPWNAPIVLGWKPTSCALACGNTVVLKPAPQTPLTTLRIGEMLRPLLPPGVLNVVTGSDDSDPNPGKVLVNHPLVRKVVFTGSTSVGSKVMQACATNFKRLLLELGGNDAAIIRADVDVTEAADGVFKAAFFNNGQTCCAIKRIYVQQSIFDSFVEALAARARRAVIGNGLTAGTELGPLANNDQLDHVTSLVEDARQAGGRILCGGGAVAGPPGDQGSNTGLFYLPTIVVGLREGSRLVDEEQFGPVVPVMPYKDDAEAIMRANGTPFGLGASVWGSDLVKANEIADKLKAGTVWVNRHCEFIRNAPFGGFGSSGIGRAGDTARDLAEYTELRTMVLAKVPAEKHESSSPAQGVVLEGRAHDMLRQQLAKISSSLSQEPDVFEADAREAVRLFPFQPLGLKQTLQSLTERDGPACALLRGLPTEVSSLEAQETAATVSAGDALLIGCTALMAARVFAYRGHCGEELVKTLPAHSGDLSGWHRPGRCTPTYDAPRLHYRPEERVPEFVAAFCLRAEQPVTVRYVDFRVLKALADPLDLECLRRSPLTFFDAETGQRTEPVAVVAPAAGGAAAGADIVDLRDPSRFEPEGSKEAVKAYHRLCKLATSATESLEVRSGDMVIFNNKRCLQAWSPVEDSANCSIQVAYASQQAETWQGRVVQ